MKSRSAVSFALGGTIALALCACRTLPSGIEPPNATTYSEIARAHNQRVHQLSTFYSRGVIELRWSDEDGRHFEQGDIDLWVELPRRTALRVEKLGTVFLWLGSDDDRFWLFDMLGNETVLYTAPHDSAIEDAAVFAVRPLALLDLSGLSPLPESGEDQPDVTIDADLNAYVITAAGQGGLMRMFFDHASRLPIRIESLSEAEAVLYRSDLRLDRYRTVPRPGVAVPQFGRMATLIDIVAVDAPADSGGPTEGSIKLALDQPTAFVDDQPMDRVFNLEQLMRAMRPHRVAGD